MSLSDFTLLYVDNTLQTINDAIRASTEDVLAVQSSFTRADGETKDNVGVVLTAYMSKHLGSRVVDAKKEWIFQFGDTLTDVYLEEVCGELHRQWLFNSGKFQDFHEEYLRLHRFIQSRDATEAFLEVSNICAVLADFMTTDTGESKSDVDAFPFAGWIAAFHPVVYQHLCEVTMNYGVLRENLYGREGS